MSVQKKSLISNRTDNKATTEPVKETAAIGTSKGLTASTLMMRKLKKGLTAEALKVNPLKSERYAMRAFKAKK